MSINGDAESFINDPGRGFLGNLAPSSVPHYAYRGREQFLNDFDHEFNNEYFLLTGVEKHIFDSQFFEPEHGPFSCWCSYDPKLELLLIKMPESTTHAVAAHTFHDMLIRAAQPTGMELALRPLGSGYHHAPMGGKQPNMAWRPRRVPPGRSQGWPSVVLEVALSERRSKLQSDVRYWLRAPQGDVKTVLTLAIDRNAPKITIEKWENNVNGFHHLQQRIVISKRANNISITGAPLIINFENLFLRPPSIPREQDIEIDDEKLKFLAEDIWNEQGQL
ncbi:hypothetical protein BDW59DRAFT_143902 [Aspergillus cavernicola]|uniref:Uncharacterized protein n=1 Tax=Aspergillus cavernicola TaxID=176166 RepID=A0ABR4IIB5_9EURO